MDAVKEDMGWWEWKKQQKTEYDGTGKSEMYLPTRKEKEEDQEQDYRWLEGKTLGWWVAEVTPDTVIEEIKGKNNIHMHNSGKSKR